MAITLDVLSLEGRTEAFESLASHALRLYQSDTNYPWAYEPSGYDFTSSGLNEVLVMRRVLPQQEFSQWLAAFWPSLTAGVIGPVAELVVLPDVLDGQGSHIVGLSLSRSWPSPRLQPIQTTTSKRSSSVPLPSSLGSGCPVSIRAAIWASIG